MKLIKILFFLLILAAIDYAQKGIEYSDYSISAVGIKSVKLNDSFWLPKIKTFTLKIRIPGWALNYAVLGDLYSYKSEAHLKVNLT